MHPSITTRALRSPRLAPSLHQAAKVEYLIPARRANRAPLVPLASNSSSSDSRRSRGTRTRPRSSCFNTSTSDLRDVIAPHPLTSPPPPPVAPRLTLTSGRPRPTAASRTSPPWSEAEGSAAAADVLARQRELPTGGYGTPKEAAGLARHVPGRARNEPPRADAVTGQTSDRRPNVEGVSDGATPAGAFRSNRRQPHSAPISRRRDGAVHRELTEGWRSLPRATAARCGLDYLRRSLRRIPPTTAKRRIAPMIQTHGKLLGDSSVAFSAVG